MRRFGPARVALRWTTHNLATEWLGRGGAPYVRLRYEDLARDPRSALREVLRLAGRGGADLGFLGEGQAELAPAHTVHGNPMRMSTGRVAIGLDEAWRDGPDRWRRGLVTGLAWPTLRRYGYA